jgi:tetratricopeptide (TPR) repeat protein
VSGKWQYAALLTGLVGFGFLFTVNPHQVSFRLYPGAVPVQTNLALVLFLAFLSGFVAAFLTGVVREAAFGLRFWIHRRAEARREEGRRLFAQGRGQVIEGKAKAAGKLLRRAYRRLPGDPGVALALARAERGQGKGEVAERRLKALIEDEPGNPEALALLLEIYRERGDGDGQAEVLALWLRAEPDHVPSLKGLRDLYRGRDSWAEAVRVQEKVLARTVGRVERERERRILSELVLCGARLAPPAKAAEQLRRVLEEDTGFAPAHGALGDAVASQGDEEGAVRVWIKGYEETGDLGLLLKAEAVRLRLGSGEEMLKLYRKLGKRDAAVTLLRARILLALNRAEEALEVVEKAEAPVAQAPAARWLKGEALFRLRSYDGASRAFRESLRADQGVPPLAFTCAGCGRSARSWEYACPECGAFGALRLDLGDVAPPAAA